MKKALILIFVVPQFLVSCGPGSDSDLSIPERGTWSSEPAQARLKAGVWEDGFVTGNGTMGVLMLGNTAEESLWLTHARCFRPLGTDETVPDLSPYREEIRRLARQGGSEAANEFFKNWIDASGWELKWTDPFRPALNLKIVQEQKGGTKDYIRTEDFATGELGVQWNDDAGRWQRRIFVSRADDVIVISLKGPARKALSCSIPHIEIPDSKLDFSVIKGRKTTEFAGVDTPANSIESKQNLQDRGKEGLVLGIKNTYIEGKGGYDIAVRMKAKGGTLEETAEGYLVDQADELLILVRVDTWESGEEGNMEAMSDALCELPADYDRLFAVHEALHRELFERSALDLGAGDAELAMPGEELTAKAYDAQRLGPALTQKLYDAGRYMLICAGSDRNPPNLQGIWTGTWGTPFFAGDYTMDANVQCAVASAYSANLPEMMGGVFSLLERHMDEFRVNARNYYGCRGIMIPSRISNTGKMLHWNKGYPGHLWHVGAAWFAHYFIEHWKYFGDEDFLREHTMPWLEEVTAFYEDFLWEDDQGKLCISPAYSAEMKMGDPHALGNNPTQDVSAIREILSNLVEFSHMLDRNSEKIPLWESMLEKLPDYHISPEGVLKEYADPSNPMIANEHRHNSPLYPLFATREFDPVKTPELWAAAIKAVEGKHKAYDWASGFGLSQVAGAAAFLERSDIAGDMINLLATTRMVYPSMLTSHNNDLEFFNVDASGNFPDIVIRCLLRSEPGMLDLLPALQEDWPAGEIRGVLARGQIEVKRLSWDAKKKTIELSLISGIDQEISLRVRQGAGIRDCAVVYGDAESKMDTANERCLLALSAGQNTRIKINW